MAKRPMNKDIVDGILKKHRGVIISIPFLAEMREDRVNHIAYEKIKLMIIMPGVCALLFQILEKVAKDFDVTLTQHDFEEGKRTVILRECSVESEIELSIEALKNAEKHFNSSVRKLVEFATNAE